MDFSNPLSYWWIFMVAANIICVCVYIFLFIKSVRSDNLEPENKKYKSILRVLGAVFVAVSMYRSVFVCSYPNRLVWFDSMANSPFIIRIFATFAEISYALLIMLPLLHLNYEMPLDTKFTRSKIGGFMVNKGPYMIFFCLFTAQFFAYSGLITQHLTLFAIEETLWTLGFLSITPALYSHLIDVMKYHKNDPSLKLIKAFLIVLTVFTTGYVIYQISFSLPVTYYSQLAADLAKPHLSGMEGLNNALFNFTATRDFDKWGGIGFFIWDTGYFTICTWMNILYAMAPRKLKETSKNK